MGGQRAGLWPKRGVLVQLWRQTKQINSGARRRQGFSPLIARLLLLLLLLVPIKYRRLDVSVMHLTDYWASKRYRRDALLRIPWSCTIYTYLAQVRSQGWSLMVWYWSGEWKRKSGYWIQDDRLTWSRNKQHLNPQRLLIGSLMEHPTNNGDKRARSYLARDANSGYGTHTNRLIHELWCCEPGMQDPRRVMCMYNSNSFHFILILIFLYFILILWALRRCASLGTAGSSKHFT